MKYANIKYNDIADGEGVRTSLFVSGCPHHCKGCFNEITWDYDYGEEYTNIITIKILKSISSKFISGLTILGGEPLCPDNIYEVTVLVASLRATYKDTKSIWIYTGYTFEELEQMYVKQKSKNAIYYKIIKNNIDVLVDGRFIEEKKDISLKFKGSSNQRIINMRKTVENNNDIILYYE